MASEFPTVIRDPVEDTNTLLLGSDAPASAERLLAAIARSCPDDLRNLAAIEPRGSGRGWPAARSTPTTGRRSSG